MAEGGVVLWHLEQRDSHGDAHTGEGIPRDADQLHSTGVEAKGEEGGVEQARGE